MTQQNRLPAAFNERMAQLLAERYSVSVPTREHHGRDESIFNVTLPDAVAFVRDMAEVTEIVKLCGQFNVPLVPYGAGSSLEGHTLAVQGGLTLNLMQMDSILAVNAEDQTATVQPGVTREALNSALRDTGLLFPV